MFSQQSTTESIEAGVPQSHYYIHAGNSSNNSGMEHNADALTTSVCYNNNNNNNGINATVTYTLQQHQPQHYHPLTMEHDMTAASLLPVSYEDTLQMNDISLAEKEANQYPTIEEFDEIVQDYLNNLSTKKRDKALVDRHRYTLITRVLKDPRNTAISTAQFRFWVKKMFQFVPHYDGSQIVCHDNKPVAMREDIYCILVQAHKQANHGGRDKTSALVRQRYSWIPKELIARFVRHCPFCIARRNGSQNPPTSLLPRASSSYTTELPVATADADADAAAVAAFAVHEIEYQPDQTSPIEGLPYLGFDFKPGMNERNFDIKWLEHHHQSQQPYFHRPLESRGGSGSPSPAVSIAGPMSGHSYSNFFFSTVAGSNTSSCAVTPCSSEESGVLYQHPTLLSPCGDISALHYGHVEQPPLYSTCYTPTPEISTDPLATIAPQHQLRHAQKPHHSNGSSSSNPSDVFVASYYVSEHQAISYDHKMTSAESQQSQRHHTMVYPHTLSSPSPSSSLSSSSSYSTPSSPPVSPSSKQNIYMQQHQSSPPAPLFSSRSF